MRTAAKADPCECNIGGGGGHVITKRRIRTPLPTDDSERVAVHTNVLRDPNLSPILPRPAIRIAFVHYVGLRTCVYMLTQSSDLGVNFGKTPTTSNMWYDVRDRNA